MNELDEIMSGSDLVAPVDTTIQQEQQPSQPRDESGRFASAQAQQPAAAEPPVVEQPAAGTEPQPNGNAVPVGAVQAERGKRQAAEAEAEALRRELAEIRGQVTLLSQQRQPAPQPQQQEQPPASIWDDPDAFLKGQLSPVQQQMQEMREMLWESQAAQKHTEEVLNAAKEAAAALAGTPQGRALHQQITAGGNPFDNLVKWHQQQTALARVGNDPDAWLNAELEKRLADPAFLAQAIERARAGAQPNPSNRSQTPVTSLPPSLSRLPSGGNTPIDNDMSDGALFSHATR